ncbi:MAG: response regulator transcription factor [Candidatus Binatia bacterium]
MNKKKILVVDDDHDLLRALKIILEANGYATAFATSAALSLDTAMRENPDLILLDLGLPDGIGLTVMERLQQIEDLASIPVIVITCRPQHVYKDAAVVAGAKGYLQKPVENAELLRAIQTALADQKRRSSSPE